MKEAQRVWDTHEQPVELRIILEQNFAADRFAYESQYRSQWDKGQNTDLVVVLRSAEQHLNKLPFDLLKAGRPLTFALHKLFPKLNYP